MRVDAVLKLMKRPCHVIIKARTTIFGRFYDVKVSGFSLTSEKLDVPLKDMILLYEEVISISVEENLIILTVRGCE